MDVTVHGKVEGYRKNASHITTHWTITKKQTTFVRGLNRPTNQKGKRPNNIKITMEEVVNLDRPLEFQEVDAPRFQENRQIKVVKLSTLRTGRLYPPGNIPGTQFC
jgi:hypothetical protein